MINKSKLLSAAVVATAAASPSYADTMGTPKIKATSIMSGLENPWDMAFTKKVICFTLKNVKVFQLKLNLVMLMHWLV